MSICSKLAVQNQTSPDTSSIPAKTRRANGILRVFHDFALKPERRRLAVGILALIISSSTNLAFPMIMGKAIDIAITPIEASRLRTLVIAVMGICGAGAFASWLRVYSFNIATHSLEQRMRHFFFYTLLLQETEFFTSEQLGDLHTRLVQDVTIAAGTLTNTVAQGLRGLNSSIGGLAMLLYLCPKLTLVTISLVPMIGVGAIIYRRYAKKVSRNMQDSLGHAMSYAESRLNNIETVHLFAVEEREANEFQLSLQQLYKHACAVGSADGLMMGGLSLAVNASLLAVLYFGGSLVRQGKLSMGNLASFALYSSMVGLGCSSLCRAYGNTIKASVSAERLFEILDRHHPSLQKGILLPKISGNIEFDSVCFSYKSRPNTSVISNFNLSIRPGEVVALTGMSGCGKTTISKLLTNLLTPIQGIIRLDGYRVSDLHSTWLRHQVFGVVNQEPVLFDMSIAANIAYGRPNATQHDIEYAAKQANADDFIKALPEQYLTTVGERGVQLSVGQRQRIAIARAILKDPPCLILDEATSSLDAESEHSVHVALERLMKGRTVLIIAHRPTTLQYANRIAVMENGTIVESGSFKDLCNKKGSALCALLRHSKLIESVTQ